MKEKNYWKPISVITGHYGCGKTNFAVNLALHLACEGKPVTVVDLDLVNPYFRTADFTHLFSQHNIRIITPNFANTNLDIPSISAQVDAVFQLENEYVIIDVGGDDAGAAVLGRFSQKLNAADHDVFYLYNACRFLTKTPKEAAQILTEIESVSRVKITKIINNTNLGEETTKELLQHSQKQANELSALTGIPIAFTTKEQSLQCELKGPVFPMKRYVKSLWDEEGSKLWQN